MSKTSPTQRALADLRSMGFLPGIVEKFNSHIKRRQDLFGCIDIIAVHDDFGVLGVQATGGDGGNHAARASKAIAEPRLRAWLKSGARFEIWSYRKGGPAGTRKKYTLRRQEIKLADLPAEPINLDGSSGLFTRERCGSFIEDKGAA